MGTKITMTMSDGAEIGAYHADAQGHRRGGLLLVQEIFGLNGHIREMCDRYAAEGFEVLSPALYDREAPGFESDYQDPTLSQAFGLYMSHPIERSIADLTTCFDMLKAKGGPVFMTGYCYGGLLTWIGACRFDGLAAASVMYGGGIDNYLNETPKCPTICHFGDRDTHIPLSVAEAVRAAHPEVPVYVYHAGHGFNSDRRADYDAESAKLAWERTLKLFVDNGAGAPRSS